MIPTYCALIFQIIIFWDSDPVHLTIKDSKTFALMVTQDLNYVSPEYGYEVISWGATMSKCEPVSPENQLKFISYLVDFDGDGKACR